MGEGVYSKLTSNGTQGKLIPKRGYINTEAQSKVCTNDLQIMGGLRTNNQPETVSSKVDKVQQN